jgi:hypothetical protein
VPVAAKRDVEIVAQKLRQRHVPAPPEIDDGGGLVRRIEIQRQEDAEHQRDADRHIRVAGEIEIQLEGVSERADPGLVEGRSVGAEGGRDQRLDAVGEAGFFEQPDREDDESAQDQMRIGAFGFFTLELRNHILVMQDRSRDQMREVGDEESVMRQRVTRDIAAIGVDQECNLGEGVE